MLDSRGSDGSATRMAFAGSNLRCVAYWVDPPIGEEQLDDDGEVGLSVSWSGLLQVEDVGHEGCTQLG